MVAPIIAELLTGSEGHGGMAHGGGHVYSDSLVGNFPAEGVVVGEATPAEGNFRRVYMDRLDRYRCETIQVVEIYPDRFGPGQWVGIRQYNTDDVYGTHDSVRVLYSNPGKESESSDGSSFIESFGREGWYGQSDSYSSTRYYLVDERGNRLEPSDIDRFGLKRILVPPSRELYGAFGEDTLLTVAQSKHSSDRGNQGGYCDGVMLLHRNFLRGKRLFAVSENSASSHYGGGSSASRTVFPGPLKVLDPDFPFDPATAKLRFVGQVVKGRRHVFLVYATQEDIRVFDHRGPAPLHDFALSLLNMGEEGNELKRFAWGRCCVAASEGSPMLFSEALHALTGDNLIPAGTVLKAGMRFERRYHLRSGSDLFRPEYIVIREEASN